MGFAQNLFEGIANAVGDQPTVEHIEKEKADRRATAHEELQGQTQSILNDVAGLQTTRAGLDPKAPGYQKDLEANDQSLHDARQALQDLYHPEKNPGALQHLGGFIRSHLSKNKPAVTPASAKKSMSDTIAGLDKAAARPGSAAAENNPFEKEKKQLISMGYSEDDANSAIRRKLGLEARAGKVSDYAQGLRRFVESEQGDPDNPTAEQEKAYREQRKGTSGSNSKFSQEVGVYETAWKKPIKQWSPEELAYFNQKMAYDSSRSGESVTTKLEKDENGNIHPIQVSTERGPGAPPIDPHAAPKTAGEAKQRMAPLHSSVHEGAPLSFKAGTPAVTKARTTVGEAVKLSTQADEVAKHPNDAINQKRLAVALERASAGRFTTQALDYIIKAGWGNTIEQWANAPSTGALPADIMRQLVDGAHQNLTAAKAALADAEQGSTGGGDDMLTVQIPGQAPGKIHASQKAAFLKKYPNAKVQ